MIQKPKVNAIMNDLITRLENDPSVLNKIISRHTWAPNFTSFSFQGSELADISVLKLEAPFDSKNEIRAKRTAFTSSEQTSGNVVVIPSNFGLDDHSLSYLHREGQHLSTLQHSICIISKSLLAMLTHLDKYLGTEIPQPSSSASSSSLSSSSSSGVSSVTQTSTNTQSTLVCSDPSKAHVAFAYITIKKRLFDGLEQWGELRDKFLHCLRADNERDKLYTSLCEQYGQIEEWYLKLKDLHSFCSPKQPSSSSSSASSSGSSTPGQGHIGLIPPGSGSDAVPQNNNNSTTKTICSVDLLTPALSKVYEDVGVKITQWRDKEEGKFNVKLDNIGSHYIRVTEALFTLHQSSSIQDVKTINNNNNNNNGTYSVDGLTSPIAKSKRIDNYDTLNHNACDKNHPTNNSKDISTPSSRGTSDWIDILQIDKLLTPFSLRHTNLKRQYEHQHQQRTESQEYTEEDSANILVQQVSSIHPSYICFSFANPANGNQSDSEQPTPGAGNQTKSQDSDDNKEAHISSSFILELW